LNDNIHFVLSWEIQHTNLFVQMCLQEKQDKKQMTAPSQFINEIIVIIIYVLNMYMFLINPEFRKLKNILEKNIFLACKR